MQEQESQGCVTGRGKPRPVFVWDGSRKLMAPPMSDLVPSPLQMVGMAERARIVGPFAHGVYQRGGSAANLFGNAVGALRT